MVEAVVAVADTWECTGSLWCAQIPRSKVVGKCGGCVWYITVGGRSIDWYNDRVAARAVSLRRRTWCVVVVEGVDAV